MKKKYLPVSGNIFSYRRGGGKITSVALFLMVISGVTGCSDDTPLPPGSSVTVQPDKKEWLIEENLDERGNCIWREDYYNDQPVLITVTDSQGSPIGEADLTVSLDLAGNTFSSHSRMKLYEDKDGNGVPDDPAELVSDEDDPMYRGKTEKYSGEKHLVLRMNLSCNYRGQIYAISDGFMGGGEFAVKEKPPEDKPEPAPEQ